MKKKKFLCLMLLVTMFLFIGCTTKKVCTDGNHLSSDWIVVKEATCKEAGEEQKICTKCQEILETRIIDKKAHTIVVDSAIDATCEESGLTAGSHCSVCNEVIVAQDVIEATGHQNEIIDKKDATQDEDGYIEYKCSVCNQTSKITIPKLTDYDANEETIIILNDNDIIVSNNNGGVTIVDNVVKITLGGEYSLQGSMTEGSIYICISEEEKITINLEGINLTSTLTNPIYIENGDKVEISAKSGTKNYIYDKRTLTTDAVGAAIYSEIDLEMKGKGELTIEATYNNGIASKKDLEIKNLTLFVEAPNNALKGNDTVTIESGTITAISTGGDAIKTEDSDVSDKGNQRGIITINGGTLKLYAACDGIDASYDAIINDGDIEIYTEKYSSYSKEVTTTAENNLYIRVSSRSGLSSVYQYCALFTLEDNTTIWKDSEYISSMQTIYYKLDIPTNAKYVQFYIYNSSQTLHDTTNYQYKSDQMTIPTTYDTYYINNRLSSTNITGSWTNYSTNQSGTNPWRPGGENTDNDDTITYSCKGIKADNQVTITGGIITINSHDDAIHANSDTLLQTSTYGIGNVTITNGVITINTDDDGIHADGTLSIEGGTITINKSYEALEGNTINIKSGTTQVKSSDDGINAKSALYISGGILYLDANGDGLDANGTITMSGGVVLALGPSNGGNGVIDYDRSFSFSGGLLLAVGASGMNQKPSATSGNTSSTSSISTSTSSYINLTLNGEVIAVLKVTKSNQNYCVLAYNNSNYSGISLSVKSTNTIDLTNDLYYIK